MKALKQRGYVAYSRSYHWVQTSSHWSLCWVALMGSLQPAVSHCTVRLAACKLTEKLVMDWGIRKLFRKDSTPDLEWLFLRDGLTIRLYDVSTDFGISSSWNKPYLKTATKEPWTQRKHLSLLSLEGFGQEGQTSWSGFTLGAVQVSKALDPLGNG